VLIAALRRRGRGEERVVIGILQQENLLCSFVSPKVICKGKFLYVEILI
jgi:hypothetical protein